MSTVAFVDDGGHTGAPFSVPTAIILGLLASFIQSLGLTIQRKSHLLNESLSPARRVTEWRRPLWLVGFAIFLIANVGGTVFQIGALPIVMLAPLGAVSLLYNAVLARFLLNDLLSKYMVMGTLLIASGAVLIGYFGVVPSPPHSLDELLDLFARPTFVAFATIFTFVFVGVLTVSHLAEWQLHSRAHRPASKRDYGTLGPSSRKRKKPDVPRLDLASLEPRVDAETLRSTKLGLAVAYGGASGTLSGACLLLAKSGVELLMLTFAGENQFGRYQSWLLLGILLAAALLQLWYLNKALKLADPTLVCPLAFCFYNTSSIALGLVYFDQVGELAWYDVVLVALGTAVLLGGVWTVSLHSSDDSDSLEERQPLLSSSPSVEEGMLANGAGVAGPHLPPVSISPSTFDIPPLASPEELLPTLPSEGGTTPKRRNSTRRPSIRLDFPDLFSPTRTPDLERNTSPDQSAVEEVGRRKPSLSALLEHGLSIGISPSSPGFHLQPRSPSLTRATGRRAPGRSMSEADAGAANEATQRVVGVGGNAERVEGEEATSGFAVMLDQIDLRRRLEAVGLGKQGGWWRRWFGRGGHPIAEEEEGFIVTSDSRGSLMAAPRPQGLGIHSAPGTSRDGRI
uniref:Uncharacterized protein n=1 Tax=Kalmanozyma brasiliensis (strain GHG001) TaxID=1365824 RepID=V5EKB0_KALBG